jgi:hypothetical protein
MVAHVGTRCAHRGHASHAGARAGAAGGAQGRGEARATVGEGAGPRVCEPPPGKGRGAMGA